MFFLVLQQLIKMLFLLLVGILCVRLHLVGEDGRRSASNLLLLIVNPCLIITVYQTDYNPDLVKGLLISFGMALAAHASAIIVTRLLNLKNKNPDAALEQYTAIYSNCGFIGIPLINSVLGSEGVFYLTAYMTVFNLLVWTHGLSLLRGRFDFRNLKEGLSSPMVFATCLAVLLYFTQIRIPDILLDSMNYLADMNTPLAMLVAGFSVAQSSPKKLFGNRRIYSVCLQKLIIVPLVVLVLLALIPVSKTITYTTLIAASCPTATTATMMAIRYKMNDTYASEIFSLSTILSIITIPLIMLAASAVL